jgi:hypothetical protein
MTLLGYINKHPPIDVLEEVIKLKPDHSSNEQE